MNSLKFSVIEVSPESTATTTFSTTVGVVSVTAVSFLLRGLVSFFATDTGSTADLVVFVFLASRGATSTTGVSVVFFAAA